MSGRSRGSVLVAEDDPSVAHALSVWLERLGYHVSVVATGHDALAALDEGTHDLLLLDLDMPGNEDLAVVRERRGDAELVPVMILTGAATLESAIEALRLGVMDYVVKPPDLTDLGQRVAQSVARGRAVRALIERSRPGFDGVASIDCRAASSSWTGLQALAVRTHAAPALAQLSAREFEIVQAVASGQRPAAIAQQLEISTNTVRSHLKAAFRKLGVHSQLELVARLGDVLRAPP